MLLPLVKREIVFRLLLGEQGHRLRTFPLLSGHAHPIARAIELLRKKSGLDRVAYVDIDAHHGDGVFYAFENDATVIFADVHEDGRYLYPGTGTADARAAAGSGPLIRRTPAPDTEIGCPGKCARDTRSRVPPVPPRPVFQRTTSGQAVLSAIRLNRRYVCAPS